MVAVGAVLSERRLGSGARTQDRDASGVKLAFAQVSAGPGRRGAMLRGTFPSLPRFMCGVAAPLIPTNPDHRDSPLASRHR